MLGQDRLSPGHLLRRQKEVHFLVLGVGPQEADIIQAAFNGMFPGVAGLNPPGIGKCQRTVSRADDKRAARPISQQGGLRVVAVEDDDQVITPLAQLPAQGEKPPTPTGVDPQLLDMRVMCQKRSILPVAQDLQAPGREALF
jgi:hypothetical protein